MYHPRLCIINLGVICMHPSLSQLKSASHYFIRWLIIIVVTQIVAQIVAHCEHGPYVVWGDYEVGSS